MTQETISRSTEVISISLSPNILRFLEKEREKTQQTRSAFLASLIKRYAEEERWQRIYKWGEAAKRKFKISSEDDIDRILHENRA